MSCTTAHPSVLRLRTRALDLQGRACSMGILNVTPDSFSDGGMYAGEAAAVARGLELASQGAAVIDVGGESSRPGAEPIDLETELQRVVPVVAQLACQVDVPISIDTTKAEVARQAILAGAEMVNDISALRFDPDMAAVVAQTGAAVVLMHMRGTPQTMQHAICYGDLMAEIRGFLAERIAAARQAGVAGDRIVIDPGIGFGKSVERDNFTILRYLHMLRDLGAPILVGPSRKAFIRAAVGGGIQERDAGTAAAAAIAVCNGAAIVRVHEVERVKAALCIGARVRDA